MYARVTSFEVDPARRAELALKVEAMGPRAKALPGMIDAYVGWRDDGQGVLVAVYRDKEAADAAAAKIQAFWGDLAGLLGRAPEINVYDSVVRLTA